MTDGGTGRLGPASLRSPEVLELTADVQRTEAERAARHARQCRQALALHRAYLAAGEGPFVADELALLLSCTDHRAQTLLAQGLRLGELDDAFALLEHGHFTVEQTSALLEETAHLDAGDADRVLRVVRSRHSAVTGSPLRGPGPVRGAARRAALEQALDTAVKQRRRAEAGRDVQWWQTADGMVVIKASLPAAVGLACLDRIREGSARLGPWDARSAPQRRADALARSLLGHDPRQLAQLAVDMATGAVADPGPAPRWPAVEPVDGRVAGHVVAPDCALPAGCSCPVGTHVPCGPLVHVHMTLAAARGDRDDSATLAGYGPIDASHARDLLHADARLVRVLVDPDSGIPIHVDRVPLQPGRDAEAVQAALDELDRRPGPERSDHHPLWPGDHPAAPSAGQATATGQHPVGQPGPYLVPATLKRFLQVRSPRCEFPGCQQPAARCDLDHDTAHPTGPTCSCNLGALCRHHHQVKQHGWRKERRPDGSVRWTSPTGQVRDSEPQHLAPPGDLPAQQAPSQDHAGMTRDAMAAGGEDLPEWLAAELEHAHDPTWDTDQSPPGAAGGEDVEGWHPVADRRWTTDLDDPTRTLLPPPPRDDEVPAED